MGDGSLYEKGWLSTILYTYTADKMCHFGPLVLLPAADESIGVFILCNIVLLNNHCIQCI